MRLAFWRRQPTAAPDHAAAVQALHDLEHEKKALDRYDQFANSQDNRQWGPNGTGAGAFLPPV